MRFGGNGGFREEGNGTEREGVVMLFGVHRHFNYALVSRTLDVAVSSHTLDPSAYHTLDT